MGAACRVPVVSVTGRLDGLFGIAPSEFDQRWNAQRERLSLAAKLGRAGLIADDELKRLCELFAPAFIAGWQPLITRKVLRNGVPHPLKW